MLQEILELNAIEMKRKVLAVKFVILVMHCFHTKSAMIAQKMMLIVLIVQIMAKIIINA